MAPDIHPFDGAGLSLGQISEYCLIVTTKKEDLLVVSNGLDLLHQEAYTLASCLFVM